MLRKEDLSEKKGQVEKVEGTLRQIEERINGIIGSKELEGVLNMRDCALEQRVMAVIDGQARDIAMDYTDLDRKLEELRCNIGEVNGVFVAS